MDLRDAERLALGLMAAHGLTDWRFKFDGAFNRFGRCNRRLKLISISRRLVLINNEDNVKNTILHEIAHALTSGWHDKEWREKALSIGCNGKRLFTKADANTITRPWIAYCPRCNKDLGRMFRRVARWHTVCKTTIQYRKAETL